MWQVQIIFTRYIHQPLTVTRTLFTYADKIEFIEAHAFQEWEFPLWWSESVKRTISLLLAGERPTEA